MTEVDLSSMTLDELKNLEKMISKAVSTFDLRRRSEVLRKLEDVASEHGFSLAELTGTAIKRKRSPSGPKYRHPSQPDTTWSGRGRKPKWAIDYLAGGGVLEALVI